MDSLPIVLLKDSGFDQELVSKVFRFLYPDKKPYLVDESIQTKEDYDKLLAKYRILLAEKDFSFFEEDELHYLISWIEERYDAAMEALADYQYLKIAFFNIINRYKSDKAFRATLD